MHVLHRFREVLARGGAMLDLQVIPPDPVVEVDGAHVCSIEGGALLDDAVAAAAVVDDLIARGLLREEAVDDHEILHRYPTGAALVEDFETKQRSIPAAEVPRLAATDRPCVVREACRLRRLGVPGPA